ncbi:MAG: hypothetical protein OXC81_06050 [Betaproteobacteria bacterium]|nr:hypothetical protein [Betaproteobacteria bacterium]
MALGLPTVSISISDEEKAQLQGIVASRLSGQGAAHRTCIVLAVSENPTNVRIAERENVVVATDSK